MRLLAAFLAVTLPATAIAADAPGKPPFWASIHPREARMRTGPARTYPASWLYRRADLPVRVIAVFKEWRKVEDPDGTQGWMQANLLSAARTAVVRGGDPAPMLERPMAGARLLWRGTGRRRTDQRVRQRLVPAGRQGAGRLRAGDRLVGRGGGGDAALSAARPAPAAAGPV